MNPSSRRREQLPAFDRNRARDQSERCPRSIGITARNHRNAHPDSGNGTLAATLGCLAGPVACVSWPAPGPAHKNWKPIYRKISTGTGNCTIYPQIALELGFIKAITRILRIPNSDQSSRSGSDASTCPAECGQAAAGRLTEVVATNRPSGTLPARVDRATTDRDRHCRPSGRAPSQTVRQEAAFDRAASAASLV